MSPDRLRVSFAFGPQDVRPVGVLSQAGRDSLFQFDAAFLAAPLPLSPFKLPVRPGVHVYDRKVGGGPPARRFPRRRRRIRRAVPARGRAAPRRKGAAGTFPPGLPQRPAPQPRRPPQKHVIFHGRKRDVVPSPFLRLHPLRRPRRMADSFRGRGRCESRRRGSEAARRPSRDSSGRRP